MNLSTILFILLIAAAVSANSIIKTTCGPVRGTSVASGKVEAFLGIPYAEPPVGKLRFKKPVSKTTWIDIYDANKLPNSCIQSKFGDDFIAGLNVFAEDCLYLNIWVPHLHDNNSELKTIIIFIHGGAFMLGSSSQRNYDGAALAQHGDVIVASLNYRVGGLGFFTGFNDDAPGNIGMHDQVAAIRWIKENAKNFQGDPHNIVLMGESAGSMSISAHLLSPLSKNLFRRAILLSGSILHPATSDNNDNLSKLCQKYASILGCVPNDETLDYDPTAAVECMKNLPAEKFSEADTKLLMNLEESPRDLYTLMLYPRVGDDFLPENTIDIIRKGNFKDTELFIGLTRDEGTMLLVYFNPKLFGKFDEKILTPVLDESLTRQYITDIIRSDDKSEDDKIIQTYIDRINEEEEYSYVKAVSDVVGDYNMNCGAIFQADIQSLRNNPVYFYVFDFLSPTSRTAHFPKWIGVPHAEDLQYIFGNPFFGEYSEMEKEFTRDLIDRLVIFAKTGNPNIPNGVKWPRYTFEDPKYLVIGKRDTVETKPYHKRCEVWRKRFRSEIDDDLIQNLKKTES